MFIDFLKTLLGIGPKKYKKLTSKEAKALLENGKDVQVIDVRTQTEFKSGHAKGAANINYMSSDFKNMFEMSQKNKDTHYILYCASGVRSANACAKLSKLGYNNLYTLKGGLMQWPGKLNK